MARSSRTARLVIALSVAAILAVFLIYVSIAGGRTPQLSPSQLAGPPGQASLVGKVVGPVHGGGYSTRGLRCDATDTAGRKPGVLPGLYHGRGPARFQVGRR